MKWEGHVARHHTRGASYLMSFGIRHFTRAHAQIFQCQCGLYSHTWHIISVHARLFRKCKWTRIL